MVAEVQRTFPETTVDQYTSDFGMPRPGTITFTGLSNCTAPTSPQIEAPASVCALASYMASVPDLGFTYTWSITGGTITAPNPGPSITFTAGSLGNVGLTVTASSNGCGEAASQRVIPIIAAPATPQIQAPGSVCPSSVANAASITNAAAGISYEWTITGGVFTSSSSGTSITFDSNASGTVVLVYVIEVGGVTGGRLAGDD